jgi:hypothetical protein
MSRKQKITFTNFFKWVFQPHFFAGDEAELEFAHLAEKNGYVVEKIPQDRKGYAKYVSAMGLPVGEYRSIKRGDYLVRNLGNLEVEVKCRTPRIYLRGRSYYPLKYKEIKGLQNMCKLTNVAVCIAIFEREGRGVKENSLKMITLDDILTKRTGSVYEEKYKSMMIPVSAMRDGFYVFQEFRNLGMNYRF